MQYDVVYNTTAFDKTYIEKLTFNLCYNYANFAGGIKVPCMVMYASKIANYATENKVMPNNEMSRVLHYL